MDVGSHEVRPRGQGRSIGIASLGGLILPLEGPTEFVPGESHRRSKLQDFAKEALGFGPVFEAGGCFAPGVCQMCGLGNLQLFHADRVL